ncbi:MAG: tRNA 2-thiocytidine(32) synthetase TtcA [Deltaproteobacteria bacterium]|nr:tRNA 2-thiocytidine(32) synthetase TtcA [Deltaproteobacteria bacterium]
MARFGDRALRRAVGQAIHLYGMISDGDRIAVGLSGGTDSLTLLWSLHERRSRIPIDYFLAAIHIDLGFEGGIVPQVERFCLDAGIVLRVEHTDYGIRAHSEENRENPCFLCARLRRKRLFELSHEMGCQKLALGHHMDDIIETLLINMCYAGEMSTMVPIQPFFGGKLTVIRPLAHVAGDTIDRFARSQGFPVLTNPCPTAETSKRRHIRKLLEALYETNPKIRGNLFRAMSHVKPDYLLRPPCPDSPLLNTAGVALGDPSSAKRPASGSMDMVTTPSGTSKS